MKKMCYFRRGLALGLVAVTALGLCACGGKKSSKSGDEHYFKAEYLENVPASLSDGVNCNVFQGDTLYYCGTDAEYTHCGIYSYNLVDGKETVFWESEPFYDEDDTYLGGENVNYMAVDEDGNIFAYVSVSELDEESANKDYSGATLDDVVAFFVENWGYEENDAVDEWNTYWVEEYTKEDGTVNYAAFLKNMGTQYNYMNQLWKISKDGEIQWKKELPSSDDQYSYSCYGMVVDKGGNLISMDNKWGIEGGEDLYYLSLYDSEGNLTGTIDLDGYMFAVRALPDGTVGVIGYGDTDMEMQLIDVEKAEIGESIKIPAENFISYDEDTVLVNSGVQLDAYNLKSGESQKFLSWLSYNISGSSVSAYGFLSDDRLAVVTRSYDYNSGESNCEITLLTEVDKSEIAEVKELHVACMYVDSDFEQKVIEFNKAHSDCRIVMDQYYDEDAEDWQAMLNSFTTAVVSDSDIDMVIFNDYSQVTNMAAKGLLTDMYEVIDNDEEIERSDFLQNVLTACEVNGKLVALPVSFGLQTVIAKASDVGTEPGWSVSDAQALLASKPEGTYLFYGMEREQALRNLVDLNYSTFVDVESGSCNFDNEEFVQVLEYANMFPETFEWEDDVDTAELLHEGRILCSEYYVGDFNEIQLQRVVLGDDVTYIGYPTAEGNGALLSLNTVYGITKNCDDKALAWEFLRQFYLPNQDGNNYYWGFSIRQDDFDQFCQEAMKGDNDGGSTYGWGSYEVEIQPATQEDVDQVKEIMAGATAISGSVSTDVFNIINEEAQFYFSGEQSAESVAAKVQSRMEIYLSETK